MLKSISSTIERLLIDTLGLHPDTALFLRTIILAVATLVLIYFIWRISKWALYKLVPKLTSRTKTAWDDVIFNKRVVSSVALLIPVMLLDYISPFVFEGRWQILPVVMGTTNIIIVFTVAWIMGSILNSINEILADNPDFRDKPIGSITQLGKIIIYAIAFVLALSIIFDKNPILLLSGFGAIAAVILLVFRDSILGFCC